MSKLFANEIRPTVYLAFSLWQLLQDNKEVIAEDEQVFLMKQQAALRNVPQGKPGVS